MFIPIVRFSPMVLMPDWRLGPPLERFFQSPFFKRHGKNDDPLPFIFSSFFSLFSRLVRENSFFPISFFQRGIERESPPIRNFFQWGTCLLFFFPLNVDEEPPSIYPSLMRKPFSCNHPFFSPPPPLLIWGSPFPGQLRIFPNILFLGEAKPSPFSPILFGRAPQFFPRSRACNDSFPTIFLLNRFRIPPAGLDAFLDYQIFFPR